MRNSHLRAALGEDVILDFTHSKIDQKGFEILQEVATDSKLFEKIDAMFDGKKINNTEKRSVLHVALRMSEDESLVVPDSTEGDAVKSVH